MRTNILGVLLIFLFWCEVPFSVDLPPLTFKEPLYHSIEEHLWPCDSIVMAELKGSAKNNFDVKGQQL